MRRIKVPVIVVEVNGECLVIPKGNNTVQRIFKKLCKVKGAKGEIKITDKKCVLQCDDLYICVEEKTAHVPR